MLLIYIPGKGQFYDPSRASAEYTKLKLSLCHLAASSKNALAGRTALPLAHLPKLASFLYSLYAGPLVLLSMNLPGQSLNQILKSEPLHTLNSKFFPTYAAMSCLHMRLS